MAVPAMTLRDVVQKYRTLAGAFGQAVPLSEFALTREKTEYIFGIFDEDYHISRFLHFTRNLDSGAPVAQSYQINGFAQSHISIDAEIETIL